MEPGGDVGAYAGCELISEWYQGPGLNRRPWAYESHALTN